jgi:glutamyl-tRNA reductase
MTKSTEQTKDGAAANQIVVLGLNHKWAPLVLREALAFPQHDLGQGLESMRRYVPEGAILSTCHRVELYAAAPNAARASAGLKRFWSEQRAVSTWEFEPHLYTLTGRKAVEHLFAVACGLDSVVIGEPEILGQVRIALREALERRSAGRVVSALFRHAVTTGKRARTETGIGRSPSSVSSAAVELARQTFGDLSLSQVLLVGAGKMGELAARHLLDKGVAGIKVVGRSAERVRELALRCGSNVAMSRLEDALQQCDIVITCTSAPHYVIRKELIERTMVERRGRPLFIVDIAVPRDVEPAVGDVPGVHLYNIDDLESAVATNLGERRAEAEKVEPIIREEADRFQSWLSTLSVFPTIKALRKRAEDIRRSELDRTSAVLSRLPEADRQRIEALTLAIEKKLLHNAITLLRNHAAAGDGHETDLAVRRLFGLDLNGSAPAEDDDGILSSLEDEI